MPYQFNPHRHVKVWLSADKTFMPTVNQLRLIRMRADCPGDTITLFIDTRLLSPLAQEDAIAFCKKHDLVLKDVAKDVKARDAQERALWQCYELEIAAITAGGNLGGAVDMLGWFYDVYSLGTYSDLDHHVKTHNMPSSVSVAAPILFNMGTRSVGGDHGFESITFQSDCLAIIGDDEQVRGLVHKARQWIITAMQTVANEKENTIYAKHFGMEYSNLRQLCSKDMARALLGLNHDLELLYTLSELAVEKDALTLRQVLFASSHAEIELICETYIQTHPDLKAQIDQKASDGKEEQISHQTLHSQWVAENIVQTNPRYKQERTGQTSEDIIRQYYRDIYSCYCRLIVMNTTGPIAWVMGVFGFMYLDTQRVDTILNPYTFAGYPPLKPFINDEIYTLHCHSDKQPRVDGDVSWLPSGAQSIAQGEQDYQNAARNIQSWWRQRHRTRPRGATAGVDGVIEEPDEFKPVMSGL